MKLNQPDDSITMETQLETARDEIQALKLGIENARQSERNMLKRIEAIELKTSTNDPVRTDCRELGSTKEDRAYAPPPESAQVNPAEDQDEGSPAFGRSRADQSQDREETSLE